jgi:hypothetical protein
MFVQNTPNTEGTRTTMKALTTINPKEKIGSKLDKNENKLYIPSKYSKFRNMNPFPK